MSDAIGDRAVDAITAQIDAGHLPLLGHLVLFNVDEPQTTPAELAEWFDELALDTKFLPKPLRQSDAFERVTGRGSHLRYDTDKDPAPTDPDCEVTLMVRDVRRTRKVEIVRHLVREVRDPGATELRYEAHLADLKFTFTPGHEDHGAGSIEIVPDDDVLDGLSEFEQTATKTLLTSIETKYEEGCTFLGADKVRAMLRRYLKSLNAVSVRDSGGVYYVNGIHTNSLASLNELMRRFANKSTLTRIPLVDVEEVRTLLTSSLLTDTEAQLQDLAKAIAKAQKANVTAKKRFELHQRFLAVRAAAQENADTLSMELTEARGLIEMVESQLRHLLETAPDDMEMP